MSFWDNLGKAVGEQIVKQKEVNDSTSRNIERKSDKRLIEDYIHEDNITKKLAMQMELKKRGYGNHDE